MTADKTIWLYNASIKSSVLLRDSNEELVLDFGNDNILIKFPIPEKVEDERWGGWQTVLRHTWLYRLSIKLPVLGDEDPKKKAYECLDTLVNLMSFMASTPVQVESYGSMKTPPHDDSIPGQTYRTIFLGSIETHLSPQDLVIFEDGITKQLMPMFINIFIRKKDSERIMRSLRWLQHSYKALTPVDEFLCLMLALEGIASFLGKEGTLYWRCEHCKEQYKECPNCQESTGRLSSRSALIRDFLKSHVGWSGRKWNDLWALRSKIAHGDQDLSKSDEVKIIDSLHDLEKATNEAIKFALGLPNGFWPHEGRFRPPFGFVGLDVTFTTPEEESSG